MRLAKPLPKYRVVWLDPISFLAVGSDNKSCPSVQEHLSSFVGHRYTDDLGLGYSQPFIRQCRNLVAVCLSFLKPLLIVG